MHYVLTVNSARSIKLGLAHRLLRPRAGAAFEWDGRYEGDRSEDGGEERCRELHLD